jgi:hypothetical protein
MGFQIGFPALKNYPPSNPGAVYDADAQAMFDARAAVGDEPSTPYKVAISDLVTDIKAVSGFWDSITQLVVSAGATTIASALLSIKGNNLTGTNMADGDVAIKTGIKGNRTNKSISTGYSGDFTGSSQNSFHAYTYVTEIASATPSALFGNGGASTGRTAMVLGSLTACKRAAGDSITTNEPGHWGLNRSGSANYVRMRNGFIDTVNRASEATNSGTWLILARGSNGGSSPEVRSDHRFLIYAMGGAIATLEDYKTSVDDFITAINAI